MHVPPATALFNAPDDSQAVAGCAAPERPPCDVGLGEEYEAGALIGDKYRLQRVIGMGGMGKVWLARNIALDVDVAIKLIRSEAALPQVADRLLVEAQSAARLGHPAIVRVFDFGTTQSGNPFIAMEMLEGESLSAALTAHGRVNERRAVQTLLPIAHALDVAHGEGIVHRDIKPANIFLARMQNGLIQPKLLDFGVAKLQRSGADRLTQAGTMVGTPEYMSPEQARGEDFDHRVDVWALSVVLYEMVTGRLPFTGKNYNALLRAVTDIEPAPTTEHGVGDDALWAIVSRGMSKDLSGRWASMHEMGTALAAWLVEREVCEDIAGASLRTAWLDRKLVDAHRHVFSTCPPPIELDSARVRAAARPTADLPVPRAQLELAPTTAVAMATGLTPSGPPPTTPLRDARRRRLAAIGLGLAAAIAGLVVAVIAVSPSGASTPSQHLGARTVVDASGPASSSHTSAASESPAPTEEDVARSALDLDASRDRIAEVSPSGSSRAEASAVKPTPALAKPSQRKLKRPF